MKKINFQCLNSRSFKQKLNGTAYLQRTTLLVGGGLAIGSFLTALMGCSLGKMDSFNWFSGGTTLAENNLSESSYTVPSGTITLAKRVPEVSSLGDLPLYGFIPLQISDELTTPGHWLDIQLEKSTVSVRTIGAKEQEGSSQTAAHPIKDLELKRNLVGNYTVSLK
ncbi:MAG: hypothetical protein KDD60_06685, partial [Bdellovibrionales bacterium]|nr:hypothetical protein [Bdellovibrionales bacterium]